MISCISHTLKQCQTPKLIKKTSNNLKNDRTWVSKSFRKKGRNIPKWVTILRTIGKNRNG